MGDIIGQVLLMALIFFVIGLIIHLTKYLFSPSYRKELSDKKLLKIQLIDFLKVLKNYFFLLLSQLSILGMNILMSLIFPKLLTTASAIGAGIIPLSNIYDFDLILKSGK